MHLLPFAKDIPLAQAKVLPKMQHNSFFLSTRVIASFYPEAVLRGLMFLGIPELEFVRKVGIYIISMLLKLND